MNVESLNPGCHGSVPRPVPHMPSHLIASSIFPNRQVFPE